MKLSQLDQGLRGELRKDGEFTLLGKATTVFDAHQQVLTYLTDARYLEGLVGNPAISCVIVDTTLVESLTLPKHWGILVSPSPKKTFIQLHNALATTDFYWAKRPTRIAPSASVSPHAVIEPIGVIIGEHVVIEPNVTVHSGTIIGDGCVIRSGTRLGTSGFEFYRDGDGQFPVICAGRLVLDHHVEIQHNCAIDRGMYGGDTHLKPYVKIDNLCYIAHDVVLGERTTVVGGTCIVGRTVVGADVYIGPNVTISNGLTIGDQATISLGSVVTQNVAPGQTVSGNFAIDHVKFIDFIKSIR
jgi:UDP-3-O-[3-hydroxymyristoyl] glucosamine N-acyltransferase